jgi:hypothetical protein
VDQGICLEAIEYTRGSNAHNREKGSNYSNSLQISLISLCRGRPEANIDKRAYIEAAEPAAQRLIGVNPTTVPFNGAAPAVSALLPERPPAADGEMDGGRHRGRRRRWQSQYFTAANFSQRIDFGQSA